MTRVGESCVYKFALTELVVSFVALHITTCVIMVPRFHRIQGLLSMKRWKILWITSLSSEALGIAVVVLCTCCGKRGAAPPSSSREEKPHTADVKGFVIPFLSESPLIPPGPLVRRDSSVPTPEQDVQVSTTNPPEQHGLKETSPPHNMIEDKNSASVTRKQSSELSLTSATSPPPPPVVAHSSSASSSSSNSTTEAVLPSTQVASQASIFPAQKLFPGVGIPQEMFDAGYRYVSRILNFSSDLSSQVIEKKCWTGYLTLYMVFNALLHIDRTEQADESALLFPKKIYRRETPAEEASENGAVYCLIKTLDAVWDLLAMVQPGSLDQAFSQCKAQTDLLSQTIAYHLSYMIKDTTSPTGTKPLHPMFSDVVNTVIPRARGLATQSGWLKERPAAQIFSPAFISELIGFLCLPEKLFYDKNTSTQASACIGYVEKKLGDCAQVKAKRGGAKEQAKQLMQLFINAVIEDNLLKEKQAEKGVGSAIEGFFKRTAISLAQSTGIVTSFSETLITNLLAAFDKDGPLTLTAGDETILKTIQLTEAQIKSKNFRSSFIEWQIHQWKANARKLDELRQPRSSQSPPLDDHTFKNSFIRWLATIANNEQQAKQLRRVMHYGLACIGKAPYLLSSLVNVASPTTQVLLNRLPAVPLEDAVKEGWKDPEAMKKALMYLFV